MIQRTNNFRVLEYKEGFYVQVQTIEKFKFLFIEWCKQDWYFLTKHNSITKDTDVAKIYTTLENAKECVKYQIKANKEAIKYPIIHDVSDDSNLYIENTDEIDTTE